MTLMTGTCENICIVNAMKIFQDIEIGPQFRGEKRR